MRPSSNDVHPGQLGYDMLSNRPWISSLWEAIDGSLRGRQEEDDVVSSQCSGYRLAICDPHGGQFGTPDRPSVPLNYFIFSIYSTMTIAQHQYLCFQWHPLLRSSMT